MNLKETRKQEPQMQKLAEKLARSLVATLVLGAMRSWSLRTKRWPEPEEPLNLRLCIAMNTPSSLQESWLCGWLLIVPCLFFFFFFTFLSTLTITSYHQMGLSPLNPKESHAGLYFLSRTWGLGAKSVTPTDSYSIICWDFYIKDLVIWPQQIPWTEYSILSSQSVK